MDVVKPIFIIGFGRSGSTAFSRLLSQHPGVAWLTRLCDKYPYQPARNRRVMRMIDRPVLGPLVKRAFHSPTEAWAFWEAHCPGFSVPCRDLFAEDVTHRTRRQVRRATAALLTARRHRLLAKITGWPRIGLLHEIFEDARFIHVMRDGRAAANSLLSVSWWWGWRGPSNWRWDALSPAHQREWEESGRSFVVLAAIQWKILMDAMEHAKQFVSPDAFLEVRYEALCASPTAVMKQVADFCELPWEDSFERAVAACTFASTNHKWREELTEAQQRQLETVLRPLLERYGYLQAPVVRTEEE